MKFLPVKEKMKQLKDQPLRWYEVLDWLFIFLLALCPIFQHYSGPIVDARATVLVVFVPYILVRFWQLNKVNWLIVLPLMCFSLYKIIHGGTSINEIGREGLLAFYLLAAASGVVDVKKFFRVMLAVSAIASVLILLQYFFYYICDFHLQLVPTAALLESSEQWIQLAETGRVGISGKPISFYRPSSIFLEPSHMALYCTPGLLHLLLTPGITRKRALLAALISVGVMASTSGLGIIICLGLWFLFFVFYFGEGTPDEIRIGKLKIKGFRTKFISLRPINILLIVALVVVVLLMYAFVDVFRTSINRILFTVDGYSAIAGRTDAGAHAVAKLKGLDLFFGKQKPGKEADWYMSAYHGTIYDFGLVGMVLSYIFYVYSAIFLKSRHRWMALMVLGLSIFTVHTHGSAYMLFYCIILLAGHFEGGTEDPFGLTLNIHPLQWQKKRK